MVKRFNGILRFRDNYSRFSSIDNVYFSLEDPNSGDVKIKMARNLRNALETRELVSEDTIYLLTTLYGSENMYILGKGPYRAGLVAENLDGIHSTAVKIRQDFQKFKIYDGQRYAETFERELEKMNIVSLPSSDQKLLTRI